MSQEPWQVVVTSPVTKALRRLDRVQRERLQRAIARLPAGDTKRLVGLDEWRLRVGDWRVRYAVDAPARRIVVLAVDPRGSAYKP